jgi:hypothetical protein
MERTIARPPDGLSEICLFRLGLQVRRLSAFLYAARLGKAIRKASEEAVASGAGLLHSEGFRVSSRHFGLLQYWRGFDELEAWSRRPPHSEWWRGAVERMRTKGDFGIYHETYLVPRERIESIYLNCEPAGLLTFGAAGEPVGADTNSRGRLNLGR